MFLKNAKNMFTRQFSITGQLTLFYSIASFLLIAVISLFLYWTITNILYRADHQFMSDEMYIIKNLLEKNPDNAAPLKQEVNDIPNSLQSSVYHYYIRVTDSSNKVIAETPNHEKRWWQSGTVDHYLLMQSVINNKWKVQIALDVSYQQKIIKRYRYSVFIVIFAGTFISIVLGYLISRKGMRKLYQLTQTTKTITANALQQRINPEFWPKELYELGMAYNQMLDRIEFSISKLIQFSDDLAHELRTPINNLMGEAEVVLSRPSTPEEYQQAIGSILEELNRVYQIIENLLFLARAENPQMDLQKTLLSANQEINVMCLAYQAVADEKNIKLHSHGDASLHANITMFRRMIGNLLSNAIKYSTSDSDIHIHVKEIENHNVRITLVDHGIGIASEHLPHLFQRFYRIDVAAGGTGLGLSIVKSIIDLHQGTISIISVPNKGTSIIITLPK